MLWLQKAIRLIADNCVQVTKISSIYETAAWGVTDQPDFLNMAIELETLNSPEDLLKQIHAFESKLGRQREIKWGPRTLDIDILLFNNEIIYTVGLVVPHPYLQDRLFVLKPLAEIAPTYVHPVLHKNIATLTKECPDDLEFRKYEDDITL